MLINFFHKSFFLSVMGVASMAEASKLQITLTVDETLTSTQKQLVHQAVDFWSDTLSTPSTVRSSFQLTVGAVDVDGVGGTIAFTGCDGIFEHTQIPSGATIWFDRQDATAMTRNGTFKDAVLHEMAHGLGFGGTWDLSHDWPWETKVLAQTQGGRPVFVGTAACQAYGILTGHATSNIILEADGDAGTFGGHWSKRIFGAELMTGYYSGGTISPITLAAFQDMTYDVDMSKASRSYRLPGRGVAPSLGVNPLFSRPHHFLLTKSITRITEEGDRQEIPLWEHKEDEQLH